MPVNKENRILVVYAIVVIVVAVLIKNTLSSYALFNFSLYSAIILYLNIAIYFVFGLVIYLILKYVSEGKKSREKIIKFGGEIVIFGLFIIVANWFFIVDGLNQSFPEGQLSYIFYYSSYIISNIPLYLNAVAFTIYGFYLIIKRILKRDSEALRKSEYIVIKIREKVGKIRRTTVSKILQIEAILIILLSLSMLANTSVLKKFYYDINYEVDTRNPDILIDRVETLDYLSLVEYHDKDGGIHNLTKYTDDLFLNTQYINREYIESLKKDLVSDSTRYHWLSIHSHNFNYQFKATEESKLYFTYNNNVIINAQYENYEDIFVVERVYGTNKRIGSWYINYTQVPYVVNETTISLNNTVLVKMVLTHDNVFGSLGAIFYTVYQFLVLDANFQVIFICIPYVYMSVA